MSNNAPPEYEGGDDGQEYSGYHRRGVNRMLIIAIGVFAVMSFYLWLIIATRVDGVLFPGNSFFPGIVSTCIGCGPRDPEVATPEQRINILVMGLDQRLDESEDQPYRTDSVVIFSIDPYTKTAGAFSIPRDTRVEIPDGNGGVFMSTRINEAYEMGEYGVNGFPRGYDGGGPQLAMDAIEHNFGIQIDYYAILNWANFIQIVDDLGGIHINVPEYVYDAAYSEYQFGGDYYAVEFDPGEQDMDGHRALEYARLRKSDNDYKRIERQQLVMRAIAAKAASLNWLDVGKAKDLFTTYHDSIRTNVPDLQIGPLALLANQVGLSNVKMVSAAPAMYPCPASVCGNAAELLWNAQRFNELKSLVFSDQRVVNEGAKITVLNGTNTPRLAGSFAGQMTLQGIPNIDITTDEQANGLLWASTQVIDVTGTKTNTVAQLKIMLGLPDSRVLTGADVGLYAPDLQQFLNTTSDIVVVLGSDANVSAGSDISVVPDATEAVPETPVFDTPEPDNTTPDYVPPDYTAPETDPPLETDVPVETDPPLDPVEP